ncbi:MAG: T9SS type A sorting domain-containing protein, partial [Lewinella sp.]|nr:T9SS type A sorting domain-containing protein [Lewinella sp.]
WYIDADGDGLGDPAGSVQSCDPPLGYVANADDECDNGIVGWSTVGPIFQENGCTGCHGAGAAGGLNLTSYATAIMGGNKCGTNILTGTTLIEIITTDQYDGCGTAFFGPSMNDRVGGNIDDQELALIRQWIEDGHPEDCNCPGDAPDADNDGFCDAIDQCPDIDNSLIGTPCDDGSDCTTNDVWREDCNCRGDLIDSDNDGICDRDDAAPNNPCTADGVVDGNEPAGWVAQPENDCDMDAISVASGDLNDFSACIDDVGLLMTAECSCGDNSVPSGGVVIDYAGMTRNQAQAASGMPDGLFSDAVRNGEDTLTLQFPFMETGEQICLTVGFSSGNGSMRIFLNNRLMTFDNEAGLTNYQAQEFCFSALNSGVQTLMITEDGGGDIRVDGTTYSACPCDNGAGSTDITDVSCLVNFPDVGWRELTNCTLEICEGEALTLGTDRYETIKYQWRGPNGLMANASTLSFDAVNPSHSGIYWLYYQNSSGCDLIKLIELTVIPAPPVTIQVRNPSCDLQNGEFTLSFTDDPERNNIEFSINGENGDYLEVADNIGQFIYSNLSEGSYDVWTRWSNGDCPLHLGTFDLVNQPAPTVNLGSNFEICEGESIVIDPIVTGSNLSYQWNTGARKRRLSLTPVLDQYADQIFTYRITVTDRNGCSGQDKIKITAKSKPKVLINLDHPDDALQKGKIILSFLDHPNHDFMRVSLTGEDGPYHAIPDNIGEYTFKDLPVGYYDTWVKWDDDSCPVDLGVLRLKYGESCPIIDITSSANVICEGETVKLSTIQKNRWKYAWNNGDTTAVQIITPNLSQYADMTFRYTVTVTDQYGCMSSDFEDIRVLSVPKATVSTKDAHCGQATGSITFKFEDHPNRNSMQFSINGEFGTYQSVKDRAGSITYENLRAGEYSLWSRWNSSSCPVQIDVVVLKDIPGPEIALGPDVVVCENSYARLEVEKNSTWSYEWSNGATTNSQTIVPTLSKYKNKTFQYSVTVTDAFGCKASDDVNVTVLSRPQATYTFKRPTCGKNNGSITFNFNNHPQQGKIEFSVNGMTGNYVKVNDSEEKLVIDQLSAGSYELWVRWGNDSCPSKLGRVKLEDIPGPSIDAGPNISVCEGELITLKVNEANGWIYRWSNGITEPTQTFQATLNEYANKEHTYRVKVTDKNNCEARDAVTVTIYSIPRTKVIITHPECGERNGSIAFNFADHPDMDAMEFSISGINGPFYRKSDQNGSYIFRDLPAGTYKVWARWPRGLCPVKVTTAYLKEQGDCVTSVSSEISSNSRADTITSTPLRPELIKESHLVDKTTKNKQLEMDKHSITITSSAETPAPELQVFPNPASTGNSITIRYYSETDRAPLRIMDPTGRLVKNVDPALIQVGWNELQVGLENVSTGTYIVLDGKGNYKLFVVME